MTVPLNLILTFSLLGVLDINTPAVEANLYSRESGKIIGLYAKEKEYVYEGDLLIHYSHYGLKQSIISSASGLIVYTNGLGVGDSFSKGDLLFKIKSPKVYGALKLSKSYIDNIDAPADEQVLSSGTLLCSENLDFPLKVIQVEKKSILISIELGINTKFENFGIKSQQFYNCDRKMAWKNETKDSIE
ncbi:hypothetical protein [Pseudoalteromonas aliena]|jgi:hypothetical protein|uniref:Uncharacterized protein n=1 Tax=Pseudoalteromonas aliena SW19 TaxID=1314866 RepID=A0ABR9DUR3_9GAMM|nr:hypothetical protein [Pseudoalteromonas aliena]MBE0358099.1 hypothetical protein [Pseudoalteromonas aliena SW19]